MSKGTFVAFVVMWLTSLFAFVTHCSTLVSRLMNGEGDAFWNAVLLILGVLAAPIGGIHGLLIWFGAA